MAYYDERYERYVGPAPGGDGLHQKTTPELMRELVEQGRVLIGEEVRLAKLEIRDEAKKAGKAGAGFGAGGILLHTAVLGFAGFLVALLALAMPVWLSALLVTVLFAAAGAVAIAWARRRAKTLYPEQTMRTLKEDKQWAKGTMQSIRSERHASA